MLPKNDFTYEFTNDNIANNKINVTSDEDCYNNNSSCRDNEQTFANEFTNLSDSTIGQIHDQVTSQDENANNDLNNIRYDNQPDLVQSCLQKVINSNVETESKSKK